VNADPAIAAELMVTGPVPVELSVRVLVVGELTGIFPKSKLGVLIASVGTELPNCTVKVSAALPALAVIIADCAVATEEAVAVNPAPLAPAWTATVAGTAKALLLLARFTTKPPVAAAAFNVTLQASVPAPVIEPSEQFRPTSTGTPVPLRVTIEDDPVEELLFSVS